MAVTEIKRDGQISEIALGNLGAQVNLRGYGGVKKDPVLNTTLSTGNYGLIEQTTHGKHIAVPLAATAVTAAPTPANSVLLVDDAGLAVGVGKYVRLYDAAGTDYAQLTSDADGGLVLGGSGANAGRLTLTTLALSGSFLLPDGSAAAPSLAFSSDTNTGLYWVASDRLGVTVGGSKVLEVASGKVLIGDTSDANVTVGLTLNQGANDDSILTFKSSDVNHLFTDFFEADTYGAFTKASATGGGVTFTGVCGSGTVGVLLLGLSAIDNTARSTSALGCVTVEGFVSNGGTGAATPGADANLFVVRAATSTRFLVDQEGDIHMDATSNINAWDDEEDIALLEAFRLVSMCEEPASFRRLFADDIGRHTEILARTGVITLNEDGRHFYSLKSTLGLLMDSMRQVYGRLRETQAEVVELRQQMLGA